MKTSMVAMLPILTKKLIMIMWKRLHLASSNIVVDDEVDGDDDDDANNDDDNNDDDWWWWQLPPQLASSAGELLEPGRLPCLHPLQGFLTILSFVLSSQWKIFAEYILSYNESIYRVFVIWLNFLLQEENDWLAAEVCASVSCGIIMC